ncbi:MAG: DUF2141 domain-containing protein [Sphingomonadaceae bacterium]|nr:MAG: DUF2141 domain-containing protein [Sphingomonadaceae bacterium]
MANPSAAPSDGASAAASGASASVSLTVTVENFRSGKGMLSMCLTDVEHDYIKCEEHAGSVRREIKVSAGRTIKIDRLAPGTYYLMVLHDENANGKMDTFLGVPKEGFGFSNNPALRAGPPRAHHVRFSVTGGDSEQRVKLRYLL